MAEQSEKGVYRYLPIECPNCGFQGKVNISRLDQTFHCKECKQVFHVTKDGTVAGERPVEAQSIDHAAPTREEQPPWIERVFVQLPAAAKWGVLGAIALLLVGLGVWFFQPAEPLPENVDGRAKLACKALGEGDWKTLKRLAKSGTTGDLGRWYEKARPADWSDIEAGAPVDVQSVTNRMKLKGYEKTHPVIDKVMTYTVQPKGAAQAIEVSLVFSEDKSKQWWLDGEQTLKEPTRVKKKKPEKHADDAAEEEKEDGDLPADTSADDGFEG